MHVFVNKMTVLALMKIVQIISKTTNIDSYKLTNLETGHISVNLHLTCDLFIYFKV